MNGILIGLFGEADGGRIADMEFHGIRIKQWNTYT